MPAGPVLHPSSVWPLQLSSTLLPQTSLAPGFTPAPVAAVSLQSLPGLPAPPAVLLHVVGTLNTVIALSQ